MANSSNPFNSRGTRIFHGVAAAAINVCCLVQRDSLGKLIPCAAGRPQGVAPATYAAGDDVDYHRDGICSVLTDGSAVAGTAIKASAGGVGVLDAAPGVTTAGVVLALDASTKIALVELFI
jgi:hypothetical protein